MSVALTYNRNGSTGGAIPVDSTAYVIGASATVQGNIGALTYAGYTFSGWNTVANGSGTAYAPGTIFAINADTVLYAIWASATSLITPTGLREHISTSLSDTALQEIIDGEEAEIVSRWGAHASQTDMIQSELPGYYLFQTRRAASITSVIETVFSCWDFTGETTQEATTLDSYDYELIDNGRQLHRLQSGPHPRDGWGQRVEVTYIPISENSKRVLALINLCKLNLAFNGLDSESVGAGEYRMDSGDYSKKRESILSGLGLAQRSFA